MSFLEITIISIWYLLATALFLIGTLSSISTTFQTLLQYGKTTKTTITPTTPTFISTLISKFLNIKVSKQYFIYFYLIGLFTNTTMMIITLLATRDLPNFLSLCYQFHLTRRFYECINIHVFSKTATMHLFHFLFGLVYYVLVPISLYLISHKQSSTISSPTLLSTLIHVFSSVCFLLFSYGQYHTHVLLALLRTAPKTIHKTDYRNKINRKGTKVDIQANGKDRYQIPYGGLFHWLSSPHYICEIGMYFSLFLMSNPFFIFHILNFMFMQMTVTEMGGEFEWINVNVAVDMQLWMGMLLTTSINLSISAITTHQWYLDTFPKYNTLNRKILVPGVW